MGLGLVSGSGSGLGLGFPTPSPALTLISPHPHPRPDPVPNQVRGGVFLVCVGKEHPAPGASGTPTTPSIYSSMSGRVRADAMSLMHAYRECAVSFAVLDDQCVMRGSFLTDYVHFFASSFLFENPFHPFHPSRGPPAPCVRVSIEICMRFESPAQASTSRTCNSPSARSL